MHADVTREGVISSHAELLSAAMASRISRASAVCCGVTETDEVDCP
jgi:hypothetical protein